MHKWSYFHFNSCCTSMRYTAHSSNPTVTPIGWIFCLIRLFPAILYLHLLPPSFLFWWWAPSCCIEKSEVTREYFPSSNNQKTKPIFTYNLQSSPTSLQLQWGIECLFLLKPTPPLLQISPPSSPLVSFLCIGSFPSASKHAPKAPITRSTNSKTRNLPLTPHILLETAHFSVPLYINLLERVVYTCWPHFLTSS